MPELLYLKLVTGEEIVGTVTEMETIGMLKVSDPLMFECGIDEGDPSRRYVYMARYAPFLNNFELQIDAKKIVFQGSPSDVVARYYDVSLAYCKSCTDVSFKSCVSETTDQIASVLEPKAPKKEGEKGLTGAAAAHETEELLENLLMAVPGPSKVIH